MTLRSRRRLAGRHQVSQGAPSGAPPWAGHAYRQPAAPEAERGPTVAPRDRRDGAVWLFLVFWCALRIVVGSIEGKLDAEVWVAAGVGVLALASFAKGARARPPLG